MADDLDPAAVERAALGDYLADLADVGPDTPVDLTRPEYALAMLVTSAHPDWQYLGERVFAALAAAGPLVTPEHDAQVAARAWGEAVDIVDAIKVDDHDAGANDALWLARQAIRSRIERQEGD